MAGAQVRRRDGLSAAATGSARFNHYRRSRGGLPRHAALAPKSAGFGGDLRVLLERIGSRTSETVGWQCLSPLPRSDCRESDKAGLVGGITRWRRSWKYRKN